MTNYLLDTNTILYRGGKEEDFNVDDFWEIELAKPGNYVYIPAEVRRELEVQLYHYKQQKLDTLVQVLEFDILIHIEVVNIPESTEAEHAVRLAASYLTANYAHIAIPKTSKSNKKKSTWGKYPELSDTRIILTALYYGDTLATLNIKDFMFLLVMGCEVWNPIDNCPYPPIDPAIMKKIENDPTFQKLRVPIEEFLLKYT